MPLCIEFLCRIKRSYIRPSPVFPKSIPSSYTQELYTLTPFASASLDTLTPRAHKCIQMLSFKIIISQLSKDIHLFFLKRARPKRRRVGSLAWDLLNSNHPLLRSQYSKCEQPILHAPQESSLPGTTKAKLASFLHAAHPRRELPLKNPKVRLAVELGPQGPTLQE